MNQTFTGLFVYTRPKNVYFYRKGHLTHHCCFKQNSETFNGRVLWVDSSDYILSWDDHCLTVFKSYFFLLRDVLYGNLVFSAAASNLSAIMHNHFDNDEISFIYSGTGQVISSLNQSSQVGEYKQFLPHSSIFKNSFSISKALFWLETLRNSIEYRVLLL